MTVLWIVLVISFIAFALAAAVRVEVASAANSFDSERALFMAKGAAQTVFEKLKNPDAFPPSPIEEQPGLYTFHFSSGDVRVKAETDAARIDLNGADEKVLASMFDSIGVDTATRNALVDSILDWRDADDVSRPNGAEVNDYGGVFLNRKPLPYNAPFENMQELMLVKNMTPEIYFGRVSFDASTNAHRKLVGLRDVATVGSGREQIDANTAPVEVLSALPGMTPDLASEIVSSRQQKRFADPADLLSRVPELGDSPAHDYLVTDPGLPNLLIATATVQPSGATKTVRLRLRTERQKKILLFAPLTYKDIPVVKFAGWEY